MRVTRHRRGNWEIESATATAYIRQSSRTGSWWLKISDGGSRYLLIYEAFEFEEAMDRWYKWYHEGF